MHAAGWRKYYYHYMWPRTRPRSEFPDWSEKEPQDLKDIKYRFGTNNNDLEWKITFWFRRHFMKDIVILLTLVVKKCSENRFLDCVKKSKNWLARKWQFVILVLFLLQLVWIPHMTPQHFENCNQLGLLYDDDMFLPYYFSSKRLVS